MAVFESKDVFSCKNGISFVVLIYFYASTDIALAVDIKSYIKFISRRIFCKKIELLQLMLLF